MNELLEKCEVNLLKRKFTMYGSDGTIREVVADNFEQFDSIYSFVQSKIGGTDYLTFSNDI